MRMAKAMELDPTTFTTKKKGERIGPREKNRGGTAKTGRLSADFESEKQQFEPSKQFEALLLALNRLPPDIQREFAVESAVLLVSSYYGEHNANEDAEPDFFVPAELLSILAREKIGLRLTVMK